MRAPPFCAPILAVGLALAGAAGGWAADLKSLDDKVVIPMCLNRDHALGPDEAIAACNEMIRRVEPLLNGNADQPDRIFLALVYNSRGLAFGDKHDPASALRDYDRALALDPRLAACLVNRGMLLYASGELDRAFADFDKAAGLSLRAYRDYHRADDAACLVNAYVGRAEVRMARQDFAGALADENLALGVKPNDLQALSGRGFAFMRLGQRPRALADFDAALRLDPRSVQVLINRGLVREQTGDAAGALADFDLARQIDPGARAATFNRGVAHLNQRAYAEAVADFTDVIAREPANAEAFQDRGLAYEGLHDYTHADLDYDQADRLAPGKFVHP